MRFPSRRFLHGFSLVEIVLAIGIISFAIISLLGLLGVLFTNSKESRDDTLIPAMARRIVEELRADAWTAFPPAGGDFHFTSDGIYQGRTRQNDSVYRGTAAPITGAGQTAYPVGETVIELGGGAPGGATLFRFTITFHWPESAPAANANAYVLPVSIAKYDTAP